MAEDQANAGEGSDPSADIKKQNTGETKVSDNASDDPDKVKKMTTDHQDDGDQDGEE